MQRSQQARWNVRILHISVSFATDSVSRSVSSPNRRRKATTLYSGSPGVVLFLLELGRVTGDERWTGLAASGADHLLANVPAEIRDAGAGLWTGIAGIGFTLGEAHRYTGDARYREGAVRCAELLHASAEETEHGARWSPVTDVISGSAGTGFYLLWSARRFDRQEDRELAARVGRELIAAGEEDAIGLGWALSPTYPRRMPNFSHGTAGVAAFLAALYLETGNESFRDAAVAGGRRLVALAHVNGDAFRVRHHMPGGDDLYYLGWCHGPVGTARLFHLLFEATDNPAWSMWEERCARAVTGSGLPVKRTPGFWNNVGQCCGSAGVAGFFLDRHAETGDAEALAFAVAMSDDLFARGTRDEDGLSWVQAEHRVRPELLQAQTGHIQGAAGIGLLLLHVDGALRGRERGVRLPDDPHGGPRKKP